MDVQTVVNYTLLFFLYSFVGWVWEVCIAAWQHHRFVNRGFFRGPLLPIYGFGALLATVATGGIAHPALVFAVGAVSSVVLEFATSWVLEKLFHARWWDYTGWFLNIQGRVCLAGALAFGAMALVVTRVTNPALLDALGALPLWLCVVAALALSVAFAWDAVTSIVHMAGVARALSALQEGVAALAADASQALAQTAGEVREAASAGMDLAREKAEGVREAAAASAAGAREVADDLRRAGSDLRREGVGLWREAGLDLRREAREGWASLRRPTDLRATLGALATSLRRRAGSEVRDPEFRPTRAQEAWDMLREALGQGGAR